MGAAAAQSVCYLDLKRIVYEQFLRVASRAKTDTCHEGQLSFGSNVQLLFDIFLHCYTGLNVLDAGLFLYCKHVTFHCTFYWSIRTQTQRNPESVCQHKSHARNKLTRKAVHIHITYPKWALPHFRTIRSHFIWAMRSWSRRAIKDWLSRRNKYKIKGMRCRSAHDNSRCSVTLLSPYLQSQYVYIIKANFITTVY